jgi:diguanylate cyclase (GGDEF)-like protein
MSLIEPAKPRILVVDDIEDNRTILTRRFVRWGYDVVEANDGFSALELIGQQNFDLVLLDIVMPEIDGLEVLRRIRKTYGPNSLPVIMVTAKAENKDVAEALGLGANDYLTKPVDMTVARARVETQLARRAAEQALLETNRRLEKEIAEHRQSEALIRHMALHDALTGLGNRVLFREQLTRHLRAPKGRSGKLAVFSVDVDGFKLVNDALGDPIGDQLLIHVAQRLRLSFPEADGVSRLGADAFGVARNSLTREQAAVVASDIVSTLSAPYQLEGHEVTVTCSVGVALASWDEAEPNVLLRSAELALHHAKAHGCGAIRFFEPEMNTRAQALRHLEIDLRKASAAKEFELYYQPLFSLSNRTISGFEALLRWRHPIRGMVSPAEFIPLAEQTGVIVSLGEWVLQKACVEAAAWPDQLKVAVNLSAVQFRSGSLVQAVTDALSSSRLPPDRLELEITESALLTDSEGAADMLHRLRSMGLRISMDDFGTGYSSLGYLRSFPFDKIKIDQSFVRDLGRNAGSNAIVRAITTLAGSLGMITTAEGVETQEQLEAAQNEGCTEVQGYLIGKPVAARDIPALLSTFEAPESKVA